MNKLINEIIKLLYPDRCPGCDRILKNAAHNFCDKCESKLIRTGRNFCLKCGKNLRNASKEYCHDCLRKKHVFKEGRTAFVYTGVMKDAMYRFKYANRRCYARNFARELVRANGRWIKNRDFDVIIPVPMYENKRRVRGYNQAEVLAKEIGRIINVPVENKLIYRIRNTAPMKALSSESERKQNLFSAFKIKKNSVKFNRVLLVDDIFTTGTTFDYVAKALAEVSDEIYCISVCAGSDRN